jgi:hypothetical protein
MATTEQTFMNDQPPYIKEQPKTRFNGPHVAPRFQKPVEAVEEKEED